MPDKDVRREILKIHMKKRNWFLNEELEKVVEETEGFTGAELENIINEAAFDALNKNFEVFLTVDSFLHLVFKYSIPQIDLTYKITH